MGDKASYVNINHSEIKLLTYNLFLRPPFIKTNESDFKNHRMKHFIKLIKDFDIVCLQEVFSWGSDRKDIIIKKCIKLGFCFFKTSPCPSFFSPYWIDAGLLILSKYPIRESCFHSYKYSVLADTVCNKGVLYAKIQINDRFLHVFTTHTQATYTNTSSSRELRSSIVARGQQLYEIGKFIDKAFTRYKSDHDSDRIILAGDLNVDSRNCIYPIDCLNAQVPLLKPLLESDFYDEYSALLNCLEGNKKFKVRDVLVEQFEENTPPTYGDTYLDFNKKEIPVESILTHRLEATSKQRLDYIFELSPMLDIHEINMEKLPKKRTSLEIDYSSLKVEKFFVKDSKVSQLSDHFGLSVSIYFYF